jgi:hypothetical protein
MRARGMADESMARPLTRRKPPATGAVVRWPRSSPGLREGDTCEDGKGETGENERAFAPRHRVDYG